MDELVFTNLRWPKVTFDQERVGCARLGGLYCEVPIILVDINASSDRRMTAGAELSCLAIFRSKRRCDFESGKSTQEFSKGSYGQIRGSEWVAMNGSAMEAAQL